MINNMIVGIILITVAAIAIGILAWKLRKKESSQEEVINKPVSEPSTPPVDEVPTESEKEPKKPKEEEVQPKFKVGDFVVSDYCMGRVVEITSDAYLLDTGQGIPFSCEHNAHIWNITKDAKDGDVLCCESGWTCIFKALNSDISFSSYCFMDDTGWFCETGSESHTLDKAFIKAYNGNIYPANREQIDYLFRKMKEAGYMWNPDTKELEEMAKPQEPTPTEEPKEEQKEEEPKEEPVLQEPAPVVKETPRKAFSECLDAFKEYVLIPDCSVVKGFIEAIYMEASYQFGLESCNGLPLLYKKENFPNVYDIYGGKRDEGAAFNSMMGWMFALLLSALKPKK
jgi:hypothetical protein